MSLPNGYKRLEYIQSSGTQYIDTGFKPNQDTRTVIDACWTSTPTNHSTLFGSRISATKDAFFFMWANDAKRLRSGYNTGYDQAWNIDTTVRRTIDKNKNVTTADGITQSWTYASFQCGFNMTLLAMNANGTIQWYASAKLYSCQIYDNDVLVRDFVPCINASGKVGLYDLVGKQFYGNAGTGTFTAGPAVASPSIFVNIDGIWKPINHIYVNINNIWQKST